MKSFETKDVFSRLLGPFLVDLERETAFFLVAARCWTEPPMKSLNRSTKGVRNMLLEVCLREIDEDIWKKHIKPVDALTREIRWFSR